MARGNDVSDMKSVTQISIVCAASFPSVYSYFVTSSRPCAVQISDVFVFPFRGKHIILIFFPIDERFTFAFLPRTCTWTHGKV